MANTPAVYPTSLATFTVKTNKVDVVNDDHVNYMQNEVVALQTYIGTNPHGNRGNLTSRLATLMATNGALAQSSGAFPTGTLYDGQVFYRTDQDTVYVYNGSSWDSLGQSLSNVVFNYPGVRNTASFITGASLYLTNPVFQYWGLNSNVYATALTSNFKKISGISTVLIYADVWILDASASNQNDTRISIGTATGTMRSTLSTTAPNQKTTSIDVSGLANGTVYDVVFEMKYTGGATTVYISDITGFGV